ncbi:hypothetical protein EIP86_006210 [Pleurotus ostreatoroseus]|nr:hypothetical protein EIP86_006210 [Pleurotus ostreatoroseus]
MDDWDKGEGIDYENEDLISMANFTRNMETDLHTVILYLCCSLPLDMLTAGLRDDGQGLHLAVLDRCLQIREGLPRSWLQSMQNTFWDVLSVCKNEHCSQIVKELHALMETASVMIMDPEPYAYNPLDSWTYTTMVLSLEQKGVYGGKRSFEIVFAWFPFLDATHHSVQLYSVTARITVACLAMHASPAHVLDLEAHAVLVHGHRTHLSPPPPTYAHTSTDALAHVRDTSDSRHDDRRASLHLERDAPPPYTPDADVESPGALPSYAFVAEPPTLAMRLFKLGFPLPSRISFPHPLALGALILLTPLIAPVDWEPTKPAKERTELLECMRRAEVKWARRCLVACAVFALVLAALVCMALLSRRV